MNKKLKTNLLASFGIVAMSGAAIAYGINAANKSSEEYRQQARQLASQRTEETKEEAIIRDIERVAKVVEESERAREQAKADKAAERKRIRQEIKAKEASKREEKRKRAKYNRVTLEISTKIHTDLAWKATGLLLLKEKGYNQYYLKKASEQGARAVDACEVGMSGENCLREYELFYKYQQDAMSNR
ncbi:hypothetical protein I4641_09430 [Waterburya agarophytonicola K14]|uniref:Uncharacterized protein n=1 Tax=Waterburya agarophytonicola KI4 TaxID=2874699 RepID=A0A964BS46_9CYAN|nr:hypothetical protein [Waterburya agarophytonicola]MCC0177197.1 hypothetical protein [Waterburya agarophytonicola KI4]